MLTDDHPETSIAYNNVASNLNAQGNYAQAQPLFETALENFRRLLTEDHPHTASCYHNLADNLSARGNTRRPSRCSIRAWRSVAAAHRPSSRHRAELQQRRGEPRAQQKYAEAQPLYEKALEIRRVLLSDDHPRTANGYSNVALNMQSQGQFAQAKPLLRRRWRSIVVC